MQETRSNPWPEEILTQYGVDRPISTACDLDQARLRAHLGSVPDTPFSFRIRMGPNLRAPCRRAPTGQLSLLVSLISELGLIQSAFSRVVRRQLKLSWESWASQN